MHRMSNVVFLLPRYRPRTQALSHGVPVVTLPAKFIRGRFTLAMYRQMGYTDLVADNVAVRARSWGIGMTQLQINALGVHDDTELN